MTTNKPPQYRLYGDKEGYVLPVDFTNPALAVLPEADSNARKEDRSLVHRCSIHVKESYAQMINQVDSFSDS